MAVPHRLRHTQDNSQVRYSRGRENNLFRVLTSPLIGRPPRTMACSRWLSVEASPARMPILTGWCGGDS